MLNYILPPIIIIISVSYLITFLFRKASELPAGEIVAQMPERQQKRTSELVLDVSHFGLKVLERIIHKAKLLSLKFHNVSNEWFQSIREKRQRRSQIQQNTRKERYMQVGDEYNNLGIQQSNQSNPQVEKIVRPMVSPNVTMPQSARIKEKNQLEDALIKRIAINPKDIEAYERLGDYYLENENFQDSLECFRQVLKLSPAHHKARLRIRRLERMLK